MTAPAGFRGIERYLLPSERRVVAVRRHWARLCEPTLSVVAALVVLFWLDHVLPLNLSLVRTVLLAGWVVLAARLVWRLLEWREDWFVVTDRRLLMRSGLITRRIAMMPLIKVTDMSYSRPPVGRLLGYGEIVIESAGQEQALRRIRYLPEPDALYLEICDLLFGPKAPVPGSGGHQWHTR
ncbi:MAG: PH domain-containing protein [Actinomycetes bacterium]